MRTTLSIPDQYYEKIKPMIQNDGYSSINDFMLALIRHHVDTNGGVAKGPIQRSPKNTTLSLGKLSIPKAVEKKIEENKDPDEKYGKKRGEIDIEDYF